MEKKIKALVRLWKGEDVDPEASRPDTTMASEDASLEKDLKKIWDRTGKYKEKSFEPDVEANWKQFQSRISKPNQEEETPVRRLIPRYWWAAAAVLALSAAWFLLDLGTGTSTYKTLATNQNQVKKIILPDQSVVWLNHNSEISYDQNLVQHKIRKVKLRGEAFFEVKPNPQQPFQIETPQGLIEVLGTSFNVRCLKTEPQTEVQVMHGLVALSNKEAGSRMEVPRDYVGYIPAKSGKPSKKLIQSKEVFASTQVWRTRSINLEQRNLAEAQEILRRYTRYRLEFSDPDLANCIFTWTLQLDKPEESLRLLEQTGAFRVEKTSAGIFRLVGKACP